MAGKAVAVQGCTLMYNDAKLQGNPPTITTPPSATVKIGGNGVYRGTVQALVAGLTMGAFAQGNATTITFTGKAIVKVDGQAVLLEDDMSAPAPTTFNGPNGATTVVDVSAKIQASGQTGVTAN